MHPLNPKHRCHQKLFPKLLPQKLLLKLLPQKTAQQMRNPIQKKQPRQRQIPMLTEAGRFLPGNRLQ